MFFVVIELVHCLVQKFGHLSFSSVGKRTRVFIYALKPPLVCAGLNATVSASPIDESKKHVVHLHYYQGLSLRETARVLQICPSTVKYRLREVIKILRNKVGLDENRLNQKETISIAKGELI